MDLLTDRPSSPSIAAGTLKSFLVAQMVKNLLQCRRPGFSPWVGKIPWRKDRLPTSVFLSGESHGHRTLASYSLSN